MTMMMDSMDDSILSGEELRDFSTDEEQLVKSPQKKKMGSNGKFVAEMRLLEAIEKTRVFHQKQGGNGYNKNDSKNDVPWLTKQDLERYESERPNYLKMGKRELEAFRPEVPIDLKRELNQQDVEEANVKILPRQVPIAESSTGLAKLQSTTRSRQLRHDEAMRGYKKAVVDISEQLEAKVIEQSRTLRDRLSEFDGQILDLVTRLQDEEMLCAQNYHFLTDSWNNLNGLCTQRKQAILDFERDLEDIEKTRSENIGQELQMLVEDLVHISYKLRGEVERLMEQEAHEVNIVLIKNLKMKSELVAKMLKKHVIVFHTTKANWEKAETRWRFLRHERALREWQDLLDSDAFVNPEARNEFVAQMLQVQRNRHEKRRLELFLELKHLVPEMNLDDDDLENFEQQREIPTKLPMLTLDQVEGIKQQLQELDEEEKLWCEKMRIGLNNHRKALFNAMNESRENLRAELHTYAALANDGDIFTHGKRGEGSLHRVRLGDMIADVSLEEFFRKSGGLKQELQSIVQSLGKQELIHNDVLSSLHARIQLLSQASEIGAIKEKEGKTAELRAIELTLEKLRTAKKAELAPLVPTLFRQAIQLKSSASIGDAVKAEVEQCLELLELVQPGLQEQFKPKSDENGNEDNQEEKQVGQARTAKEKANSNAKEEQEEEEEEEEEEESTIRLDSAELAYKEKPLNLVDLRNAQRRIGTVVHVSNLPVPFIEEILACQDTMAKQMVINEIIDGVVAGHCDGVINQRDETFDRQCQNLCETLTTQQDRLRTNGEKIAQFFAIMAKILQECNETEERTDLFYENALDQLLDKFEDEDATREDDFKQITDRLRHAADKDSLERHFKQAVDALNDIENGYRDYHRDGIRFSKEHPDRANTEATQHHQAIGSHFGLMHIITSEAEEGQEEEQAQEQQIKSVEDAQPTESEEKEEGDLGAGDEQHDDATQQQQQQDDADADDDADEHKAPSQPEEEHQVVQQQDVVASVLKPQVLDFFQRYRFVVEKTCDQLAEELLVYKTPAQIQEERELAEAAEENEGEEDDLELPVDEDVVVEDDTQSEAGKTTCDLTVEAAAEEGVDEKVLHGPKQIQEIPVEPVFVETFFVATIVHNLRQAVLATTCESRRLREAEMETLCNERCEEFTEELEERLRLHWPRKGRTDVKFQQPRSGELLQHQQRHDRHVRAVMLKNVAQGQQFDRKFTAVEEALKKFRQCINGLTLHLEAQKNVASLQGIFKKGKDTIASFQNSMSTQKEKLLPFVRRSNEIMNMNAHFLSTCLTFEEGGDYNVSEVELEKAALQKVEESLVDSFSGRAEKLQTLFSRIRDTRVALSQKFHDDFERCLQALSVREGLGRKYGAPRRNAQEKLRSEIAVSENAEHYIQQLLRELGKLCRQVEQDAAMIPPRSVQIKICMDSIRRCVYLRAKYLEFFGNIDSVPFPKQCVLNDIEDEEAFYGKTDDELMLAMGTDFERTSTFWQVVQRADEACRAETRELYASEGMLDELMEQTQHLQDESERGLPESLALFLREYDAKARLHKENASRKLRDQLNEFQEILVQCSNAIFSDFETRTIHDGKQQIEEIEARFHEFMEKSERIRIHHSNSLHPSLGEPCAEKELEQLITEEEKRIELTTVEIGKAHAQILDTLKVCGQSFATNLMFGTKNVLMLLDHTTLPIDLGTLPGDELVVTKRMGLKKLRKKREKEAAVQENRKATNNNDDRKVATKVWQELDVSKLNQVATTFKPLGQQKQEQEQEQDCGDLVNETESVESIFTSQHRSVIQARNQSYTSFVNWFEETIESLDDEFKAKLQDANRWKESWNANVDNLKKIQ